jgi:hypothetical protein
MSSDASEVSHVIFLAGTADHSTHERWMIGAPKCLTPTLQHLTDFANSQETFSSRARLRGSPLLVRGLA